MLGKSLAYWLMTYTFSCVFQTSCVYTTENKDTINVSCWLNIIINQKHIMNELGSRLALQGLVQLISKHTCMWDCQWFEPRSISYLSCMIVRVREVFRLTDVSTTWAVVTFRVKRRVVIRLWYFMSLWPEASITIIWLWLKDDYCSGSQNISLSKDHTLTWTITQNKHMWDCYQHISE